MKDSSMNEDDFPTETSENESVECDGHEISVEEPKKSIHDHPFSIESILNGRTKRRKPKLLKNFVSLEERRKVEENTLPLSALEEFTNKAFSTMRPERMITSDKDEGIFCFDPYFTN
jgi:hypothetical protein